MDQEEADRLILQSGATFRISAYREVIVDGVSIGTVWDSKPGTFCPNENGGSLPIDPVTGIAYWVNLEKAKSKLRNETLALVTQYTENNESALVEADVSIDVDPSDPTYIDITYNDNWHTYSVLPDKLDATIQALIALRKATS